MVCRFSNSHCGKAQHRAQQQRAAYIPRKRNISSTGCVPSFGTRLASARAVKPARPGAQGLEEQLLNVVARHERPELEAERGALAARMGADRAQLAALEAALLSGLARASGNILDNQARPRPAPHAPACAH